MKMKIVFSLLFCMFCFAAPPLLMAQDNEPEPPITFRLGDQVEMNKDSIGFAFLTYAVGLISPDAKIFLYKVNDSGEVIAVIGNTDDESGPKGIKVSGDGNVVHINAECVVIERREFNSHQEADNALRVGEEYSLIGERIVYIKK